jgi:hypothetical protein
MNGTRKGNGLYSRFRVKSEQLKLEKKEMKKTNALQATPQKRLVAHSSRTLN